MRNKLPKQVTFTARAKVTRGAEALKATTDLHGKMLTTALARMGKGSKAGALEKGLKERFDINRRMARAIILEAEGMRTSAVEGAAARLVGAEERLWRLEKRIERAENKDRRQLRGLHQRLEKLRSQKERDAALASGLTQPSICLGGKKLAKQRHSVEGEAELASWRDEWERSRNAQAFFPGERDRPSGNNECKLHLGDGSEDHPDTLVIRAPKDIYETVGQPVVILQLKGLDYAREQLLQALEPDAEHLRLRQEAHAKGESARKGGQVAKKKPEDTACRSPLTVRVWTDAQGVLRVALTILRDLSLPDITSDIREGAVGIDVNPDHLAVCRIDKFGNPVSFKRFDIFIRGSQGLRSSSIHKAVSAATKMALADEKREWAAVPVVTEHLNFGYARQNLRYLPAKLSSKLSSFAYSAILQLVKIRCANLGIESFSVSPSYTSKLGQANYAAPYGVSTDLAAACCIARRGRHHNEKLRPTVLARAPEDARVTSMSRDLLTKRSVRCVSLPKRSLTDICPWLARGDKPRASAPPASHKSGARLPVLTAALPGGHAPLLVSFAGRDATREMTLLANSGQL